MFCFHCGKEIPDKVKFCPHCGKKVVLIKDETDNKPKVKKKQVVEESQVVEDAPIIEESLSQYSYNASNTGNTTAIPKQKWYQTNVAVILLLIFIWPVGLILMWMQKKWSMVARVIISIICAFIAFSSFTDRYGVSEPTQSEIEESETKEDSEADTEEPKEDSKDLIEEAEPVEETPKEEDTTQAETPNYDNLSEEEYKNACQEMWHDDIFFSEEDLEGKLVKLDLFVNEIGFFKTESIYNPTISDAISKYDLQRTILLCGVQRKEEFSYIGGELYLYFSNKYDVDSTSILDGNHLIIYGEIIDYSTVTVDGYNECGVIPRYLENNG